MVRTRPIAAYMIESQIAKFNDKIEKTEGCWNWTGIMMPNGYGQLNIKHRGKCYAHRIAYTIAKGEIPPGLDVDHLCRNRKCVNPAHLEAVTRQVNLLRGETIPARCAAMSTCARGHALSGSNLYMYGNTRSCRICHAMREQKRRDRLRIERIAVYA